MSERDLDLILKRMAESRVNRRGFLAAAGLAAGSAALAACTSGTSSAAPSASAAPSSAPSTAPSAAPSAAASAGASAAPSVAVYEHTGVEPELYMYNWSNYISPDNIEAFKTEYGLTKFQYDIFANNEELIAKLQGGASGYDIAAPTAEYVPAMVEEGFLQKLDLSKIPNVAYIGDTFKNLWWDPTNEYQVPKDYGRPASCTARPCCPPRRPRGVTSTILSRAPVRARRSSWTRWATSSSSRSRCSATR